MEDYTKTDSFKAWLSRLPQEEQERILDMYDEAAEFSLPPDDKTKSTEELTAERGGNYGHPYDHFQCTQDLFNIWEKRRDGSSQSLSDELEKCLRHIVYMNFDKMARAAENPMHMDDFEDVGGYSSLWPKCVKREDEG